MRKFLVRTIPIVILIIFILVMNSDKFLKRPLVGNDNIPNSIQLVIKNITEDRWDEANAKTNELSAAWKKVVKRVQFSAEKDKINSFNENLARLRGAIISKDKPSAIMELNAAYEHWNNLGK